MSKVTNLIISFSITENLSEIMNKLNDFSANDHNYVFVSVDNRELPPGWYGGGKFMETNLVIGAYNHLPLDELILYLCTIKWQDPMEVQLIVKEQFDLRFRIIDLFPE